MDKEWDMTEGLLLSFNFKRIAKDVFTNIIYP